jgi:hypothetical protein
MVYIQYIKYIAFIDESSIYGKPTYTMYILIGIYGKKDEGYLYPD